MSQKRSYFRFTTPQQRKFLFETWEKTGSVTAACRKAHVGRGTFYYWKSRFEEQGYAGLEEFGSRVAHRVNRKEEAIEQRVIELRRANPAWGKKRIADEIAKEHSWVPLVSPNTVRRILQDAGMWPEQPRTRKKKGKAIPTGRRSSQDKRST